MQAPDLRRRRKNSEGFRQGLAGAVVGQLAAKLEPALAQLALKPGVIRVKRWARTFIFQGFTELRL